MKFAANCQKMRNIGLWLCTNAVSSDVLFTASRDAMPQFDSWPEDQADLRARAFSVLRLLMNDWRRAPRAQGIWAASACAVLMTDAMKRRLLMGDRCPLPCNATF